MGEVYVFKSQRFKVCLSGSVLVVIKAAPATVTTLLIIEDCPQFDTPAFAFVIEIREFVMVNQC